MIKPAIVLHQTGRGLTIYPPSTKADPAAMILIRKPWSYVDPDSVRVGRVTFTAAELYRAARLRFMRLRIRRDTTRGTSRGVYPYE